MSATNHPAFGRIMPFVFVFLWSTGFVGAKFGLPYADPFVFLFVRFAIVILLMVPVVMLMKARWPSSWREASHIGTAGVLVHGIYLGGVFWAIDTGLPSGLAALIVGLQPVVTASVVGSLLGERVSMRQWGGLVLGLVGVALVLVPKIGDGIGITPFGIGLAVMALLGMTAGTLYQKRFCTGMDLMSGTVIQYVAAAAFVGVVALFKDELTVEWSMNFILAMAWLVLVLSIGAIMLLMVLIKQGEATRVASMFYLVPPTAAFFAWVLFDEHLGALGFAGFGVAALGVALVIMKR
ncbi:MULTISPECIES: DMT family transporter [Thalassospira]|jgi:drug/metabolite transporter (DMT)-like permease|uniref:DMT family transporter n=1 Tax=Thalassospira povalilytica TaxID=732237 RepID=A0A8I1M6A9_9PROT|nr:MULTISPECIES: DMT family transporter [Thalassospira]MEE3047138.1 DMT family transporter [Pseudomonadota bacterium]MAL40053.1 EamA family transporter [Thalassospira sp.]MBN8195720.1 DMT family transporter [Thalassospira povalilytica]MCC4239473.1 DMT family transporter [Thalassospira povalilytica]PKR52188.1 EamA family transporter [Thalassospira povalilytica]|tara:strand:- start:54 stop:935 length:882 start_codon:yes stop_codon:yes gene_type:complete